MRYTGNYKQDYPHCIQRVNDALNRIKKKNPARIGKFLIETQIIKSNQSNDNKSIKISPFGDINAQVRSLGDKRFLLEINYGCFKYLNDECLQALISHEMAHIIKNHFQLKLLCSLIPTFILICLLLIYAITTKNLYITLILIPLPIIIFTYLFSKVVRQQEEEADIYGIHGSSADAMIELMEQINLHHPTKKNIIGKFLSSFGTHPYIHDRIRYLKEYKEKMRISNDFDFEPN